VIPAYNARATVGATLRSVLRQTIADLEVLVVDDGSDDGTAAELERVRDPRVEVLTGDRRGVAAARNRGLEHSRGEFVSFVDADDLWTADKLERQVAALGRCPDTAVAYSWTAFIADDGSYLFAKERSRFEGDVHAALATENFLASGSNALARREALERAGGFDERFSPAEDWEFWLRVAGRERFALVPRYQVLYRLRSGSRSSDVDWMEAGLRRLHAATFGRAGPELRRREREALATIAQYTAFLRLTRTAAPGSKGRAGRLLRECVALHPRGLASRKVQFLLWTWLAALPLPARVVPRFTRALVGVYGRAPGLCDPEELRGLVGVGEDLEALGLVPLEAPDVHHRNLG
jgi:GT2 family glycosyltransferase